MKQHLRTAQSVASSILALGQGGEAFSVVQAMWRFVNNERISLPQLAIPMIEQAKAATKKQSRDYVLVMHDWSPLHYTDHDSKADRIVLYNKNDYGYLLQSALAISDKNGAPIAPLYIGLEAKDGVHSSRCEQVMPARVEMDEANRTMGYTEQLGLAKPLVHIIDRQADSLLHLRRFVKCRRDFIIRGNDVRRVQYQGKSRLLSEVEQDIKLDYKGEVQYHAKKAKRYVGETSVVLTQPAFKIRIRNGKPTKRRVKGKPIALRLIISEVRDNEGKVLATWRLWSNLPFEVDAATIALWYYWRWRIETFFKLIKRAGQCLEQWQQETAAAIARRLMVAMQACTIVWALQEAGPEVAPLRKFLIKLSGRVLKRNVESTAPALFAGIWQLLTIIDTLQRYSLDEIEHMAHLLFRSLGLRSDFSGFS